MIQTIKPLTVTLKKEALDMMCRQKCSVDYLVCWCAEEQVTEAVSCCSCSSPANLKSLISLVNPSGPAAIAVLQTAGNDMFTCMSWLMQSLMASSDWPPQV